MKKSTLLAFAMLFSGIAFSQTLIFDNGPLVNNPGAGTGGADVSAIHDGFSNYGFNQNFALNFRMADDFVVPPGATWTIDSIVTFGYQTQAAPGGSTVSTFTDLFLAVFNDDPSVPTAVMVLGDTTTSVLSNSYWSGIWRTNATTFTATTRGLMRNVGDVSAAGWSLTAGTYWLVWCSAGTAASGPWNPPITIDGTLSSGNGRQSDGTSWFDLLDSNQTDGLFYQQGLPFELWGNVTVGINENPKSNVQGISNLYPVPAQNTIGFNVNAECSTDVQVLIKDELGREVITDTKPVSAGGNNRLSYDVSHLAKGAYFISVRSKTFTDNVRFIKN